MARMQHPERTERLEGRSRLSSREGPARSSPDARQRSQAKPQHPGEDESGHDRHRSDQTWAARAAASGKVSPDDIARAMDALPATTAVMTAGHEQTRAGMLVHRVMACATEPPMLCVAVRKGHHLASIIRDARCFGLCVIEPTQRLMMRKFALPSDDAATTTHGGEEPTEPPSDPFDSMQVVRLVSTAPILVRSVAAIDCEVVRHLDLEADCELYVGQVLAVRLPTSGGLIDPQHVPGRNAGLQTPILPYDSGRLGA